MYVLCLVTQPCPTLCDPMDCSPPGSSVQWGFPRQEYWSGLPCPPPGDLPNPGIEPRSPTLQAGATQGSPRILEWVAYPFSRGSSWPRNPARVSCIAGEYFELLQCSLRYRESSTSEILKSSLIQKVIFFPYYLIRFRLTKYILKV